MDNKILVFVCFSVFAGVYGKYDRIIGGEDAERIEFPYLVSIRTTLLNHHFCAGSIIVPEAIMTAAHCFFERDALVPFIKIHSKISNLTDFGTIHSIKEVYLHPDFVGYQVKENRYHNDIAIVKVNELFAMGRLQNLISLPTASPAVGDVVTICGWGVTTHPDGNHPRKIQKATMQLKDCANYQQGLEYNILNDQLCTLEEETRVCIGDSGGPMVKDNELVGIISFSRLCNPNIPDVYTDVYKHHGFILSVLLD